MNREEYDSSIEPSWKFDRSLGIWSYQQGPFTHSIFEGKVPTEDEGFVKVNLPSLTNTNAYWQEFLSQIPQAKGGCKGWLWQLSLDLTPMNDPVTDEGQLRSCKWAISEFNKQVWSLYRRKSLGAILYSACINHLGFYWDLEQLEQFIHWMGDVKADSLSGASLEQAKKCLGESDLEQWNKISQGDLWAKLYTLIILSQYWHYLASGLEEDCPALVYLDFQGLSLQEQVFLLARPHFDHVRLIVQGAHGKLSSLKQEGPHIKVTRQAAAKLALLVPHQLNFDTAAYLANAMQALDRESIDYKIILESELVFEWQDVEELVVFACEVSELALRGLRGFKAASGEIYAIGKNPHLVNLLSQWPSSLANLLLTKECGEA